MLVVAGILLALQIDNWKDKRQQQNQILEEGNGEVGIELYDSQGRLIQSLIDKYPGTLRLEMGTLKAGIYMVKISLDGKYLSSRRIIKC